MKILGNKIFFFPTRNCNLRCRHCFIVETENLRDEVLQIGTRIVDGLTKYQGDELRLAGGEPTIVPGLHRLIEIANANKIKVSLITNGLKLDKYWINILKKYHKNHIWFSIYGIDEYSHDFVTGMLGSFKKVNNSIYQALNAYIHVGYNIPITRHTIEHIVELINQAKARNISSIKFLILTPPFYMPKEMSPLIPTSKEVVSFCSMKSHLSKIAHGISLKFPVTLKDINQSNIRYGHCFVKNRSPLFTVTGKGEVFPCCLYVNKSYALLGNILKCSWESIYDNFQLFTQYLDDHPELCCDGLLINNICPISFLPLRKEVFSHA